ncbi:GH25 family lysozyme [Agrilactobacillus yilanensis]|uniref:GH25 family lysozyme n=1 Tax=Agrilactobacillus yilanensis TaxID=2485997 RepID=A0ABW4J893_9LACO|nr:GH25 family lysozyme [Agrilactobacillus yilanensis]
MFRKKAFKKLSAMFLLGISVLGAGFATAQQQVQASSFSKFADVASYQDSSESFFQNLATGDVAGVVIKLTEGTGYVNPKAAAQIKSAQAAGMKVSLYHYARYSGYNSAKNEADFFANTAESYGLDKSTVMVADVEDSSMSNPYGDTQTFQAELAARGYSNQVTYSMASWFWYNKVPTNYPIWVANYGVNQPGVDNAAAWQYTSNYNGMNLDMSYDFTGLFTNNSVSQAPSTDANTTVTTNSSANVATVGSKAARAVTSTGKVVRYFDAGSQWRKNGIVLINGKTAYAVGDNVYLYQDDTTQAGIVTINAANSGVTAVNKQGKAISGSSSKFTNGSQWLINSVTTINDKPAYQVSDTEYIMASDANGSGNN